ncbi:hypothetical protein CPB84DRAFT_1848362 [Gymnopilus junonius]|uniref:Uncharacterized protein n=1 Tax=Gymnopilus junonius TaxID=109634 RepID=A0A9P5NKA6_GYMJU|nr:hypothetical protein CPB84DRAFT_1848362 [Gymnopilus junonius]
MSNKRRDPLPRLNIASNLNMQQPGQSLFSPALPTALQQSFHPTFPMNTTLQTPMQPMFSTIPGAPGRPTHAHHASMQLAAAGIHPPNLITPVATHFPRPSMMLAPGAQPQAPPHPFPNRNRRQPSIGGPPKAVLGGPARKLSPLPGGVGSNTVAEPQKKKKVIVNLPKETIISEDGGPTTRSSWARSPLANAVVYDDISVAPAEVATAELFPPDGWRRNLPDTIDVFLPGKLAWDAIKQRVIEEKLQKLGVERGSGKTSALPIHAPHARAASISSPADPALLLFKLNKLQQAQEANSAVNSAANSLSVSPQPPFVAPFGLSPSPNRGMRLLTNRHGHTMSLAQPPSYQSSLFSSSPSPFNPFGPHAVLGTESVADSQISESSEDPIHAPQGRVPIAALNFVAPPVSAVNGTNNGQADFTRGFGLDVPLELEEDEESRRIEPIEETDEENESNADINATQDMQLEGSHEEDLDDGTTTAPQTRLHSRHVSKLSAALSLRSVGGNLTAKIQDAAEGRQRHFNEEAQGDGDEADKENEPPQNTRNLDVDPVEEWTGSEDLYLGLETSDDESIGEWSNPSDEERARQQRVERRMRRRAAQQQQLDQPRRLPNFPRPPENPLGFVARRDDDIISNPSEENFMLGHQAEFAGVSTEHYHPHASRSAASLGIPPHSRGPSDQYSAHDPAMAHSRHASGSFTFPQPSFHQSSSSTGRRDSLNPFAKPFVFGAPRESGSWQTSTSPASMPSASVSSHSRLPSIGKPLNVDAPEFKPGGFNFRLPGAPQMPPAPPFPQPQHQVLEPAVSVESSPFKTQGREKRQRRGSNSSIEEGDSMASFKFPMRLDSSPQSIRRRRSGSLSTKHQLNPSAQPFTFAGFSAVANNIPWVPKTSEVEDVPLSSRLAEGKENLKDTSTAKTGNSEVQSEEVIVPVVTKQKRAPIPLDFKHPVSSNTVPAGLFKALVNGNDERTRRSVRSRLSSREIFDFEHVHRPSMDDDDVALIAHKNPRNRIVTDPDERRRSPSPDNVFNSVHHARRRSSLPDALHDKEISPSRASLSPRDLTMEVHHIEDILNRLLDEKMDVLLRQLPARNEKKEVALPSTTESMMADLISLFRTQLQESATRSLEDSQMDARGELDFQMIKDVETSSRLTTNPSQEILPIVEEIGERTREAVIEAISGFSARQEAMALNAPSREHDLLVENIFLTRELTQAVKPHISQLIDLASDKRETAGLIVDRILPLLPSLTSTTVDTDAITLKLIAEVRRAIAPIDAFEIKEQVADLVVERLDSRLAVRDKAFNVDVVTSRVTESVSRLLDSLNKVPATLERLAISQQSLEENQASVTSSQSQIVASIVDVPVQLVSQFDELSRLQKRIFEKIDQSGSSNVEFNGTVIVIKDIVESLALGQKRQNEQSDVYLSDNKLVLDKLNTLPQEFSRIATNLQSALTELFTLHENSKREIEELRKLNADYQIQVTKARGSHGQVRVEKDVLNEKLALVEGDRDRLRAQAKELQVIASDKEKEVNILEARNRELEDALSKALARLQSADVTTEGHQRSITDLEKTNKDLSAENLSLKSKVDALGQEVAFANREREATSKMLEVLQNQHTHLISQQSNWDVLNVATEKINMVFNLLENADSEEQKELRHYRDRSQMLGEENATLQKRIKELEGRFATNDRTAAAARQSLAQAQQRSTEWEHRAKECEGQLELFKTKYEQSEQTHAQLEADYEVVKMQLEEYEADKRLQQDRENKSREQIAALESKCVLLQKELEKANAARTSATSPAPLRSSINGNTHAPPRPDSRASTIYDHREETPNRRVSSYSSAHSTASAQSASHPSVWDSMHAPASTNSQVKWTSPPMHTPISRYSHLGPSTPKPQRMSSHYQHQRGPSPTPSTVSAAPTQGNDGWWS